MKGGRESITGGRGGGGGGAEKRQGRAGSWEVQGGAGGCSVLPPKDQARLQDGGGYLGEQGRRGWTPSPARQEALVLRRE